MKLLRNLLKGASLTTALFIFQACYGSPRYRYDSSITFKVVSAEDKSPLDGIIIKEKYDCSDDYYLAGYTDKDGLVTVGYMGDEAPNFRFESEDDAYLVKDTVIVELPRNHTAVEIKLQKAQ